MEARKGTQHAQRANYVTIALLKCHCPFNFKINCLHAQSSE